MTPPPVLEEEYMCTGNMQVIEQKGKVAAAKLVGGVEVHKTRNDPRHLQCWGDGGGGGDGGGVGCDDEAFDLQMILRKYMCCLLLHGVVQKKT